MLSAAFPLVESSPRLFLRSWASPKKRVFAHHLSEFGSVDAKCSSSSCYAVAIENSKGSRCIKWTLLYEVDRYHGTWLQSTYLSPGSLTLLHHDRPFSATSCLACRRCVVWNCLYLYYLVLPYGVRVEQSSSMHRALKPGQVMRREMALNLHGYGRSRSTELFSSSSYSGVR